MIGMPATQGFRELVTAAPEDREQIARWLRFLQFIEIDENGCWMWLGATNCGYGVFFDGTRLQRAHRYAYTKCVGPVESGLVLDHLCRKRACANPDHLEATTQQINILRGVGATANNAKKTACPRGHAYHPTIRTGDGRRRCVECHRPRIPGKCAAGIHDMPGRPHRGSQCYACRNTWRRSEIRSGSA